MLELSNTEISFKYLSYRFLKVHTGVDVYFIYYFEQCYDEILRAEVPYRVGLLLGNPEFDSRLLKPYRDILLSGQQ